MSSLLESAVSASLLWTTVCVCVRVRVCMQVCVCVQSKYSPGIRVWAWKNKTLALKQRFADVVWPRVQPLQSVITTCVCVCMLESTSSDRWDQASWVEVG